VAAEAPQEPRSYCQDPEFQDTLSLASVNA